MQQTVAEYVAAHPKMAGALFTVMLVLSQAAPAAANVAGANPGP